MISISKVTIPFPVGFGKRSIKWKPISEIYPNVAKAEGLQSPRKRDFRFAPTSVKGEAVIGYREPLTTRVADSDEDGNLRSSSFPER